MLQFNFNYFISQITKELFSANWFEFETLAQNIKTNFKTCKDSQKMKQTCDKLRDLVPFEQFTEREKHTYRSVTLSKVSGSVFFVSPFSHAHKNV